MLKLKSLILFVLISFSLQDNNCLIYFETCEEKPTTITIANCIKISYSYNENNEKTEYCKECQDGYVRSNDRKKCIKIENPIQYCIEHNSDSEDKLICSECDSNHVPSNNQKSCEDVPNKIENCIIYSIDSEGKSLCDECKTDYFHSNDRKSCLEFKNCRNFINYYEGENEYCDKCNYGYALSYNGKSCEKFENCYKLAEGNKKCSECVDNFHPNAEGKCERTLCEDYDTNDVCIKCYEGYYLDKDKNCQKIAIEYCLEADSKGEKCISCQGDINPDANGKCNLPSPLIKGCIKYKSDGKCDTCQQNDYKLTNDGGCQFIECKEGENKYEYCAKCKAGYFDGEDANDNDICIGYDGSMDTPSSDSSSRNKVECALLIFILALLI